MNGGTDGLAGEGEYITSWINTRDLNTIPMIWVRVTAVFRVVD